MENYLKIIKTLFKGREDVFAIRWERKGKAGYMPAYNFDWNEFLAHKTKGGNLKNFLNKQYASLTDGRVASHLNGKEVIGSTPY